MFYKKLPSGKYRYYEKYYNESERKWKQVSITLNSKSRQAQSHAKQLLADKIDAAQDNLFGFSDSVTISEIIPEWLEIRKKEVKHSTYTSQFFIINSFRKVFDHHRLKDINGAMLQRYLMSRQEWSNSYRILSRAVLGIFFDYCKKVGYLNHNPIKQVVLPKQKKTLEELKQEREKFLSHSEMKDYLSYLNKSGSNPTLNLLIEVMYLTGLRSGEALGLTWDVIDVDKKTIEVKQTLQMRGARENYYLSSPKTLTGYRTVTINDRCVEIFKGLRSSESEFVFTTTNHMPIYLNVFNNYLRKTFKNSGLAKSQLFRMTSHVLRHSHISLLVEMNIPLRVIMDRVGHSDEKTTLTVYTHVTEGMKMKLGEELEAIDLG